MHHAMLNRCLTLAAVLGVCWTSPALAQYPVDLPLDYYDSDLAEFYGPKYVDPGLGGPAYDDYSGLPADYYDFYYDDRWYDDYLGIDAHNADELYDEYYERGFDFHDDYSGYVDRDDYGGLLYDVDPRAYFGRDPFEPEDDYWEADVADRVQPEAYRSGYRGQDVDVYAEELNYYSDPRWHDFGADNEAID